ncbi:MAG: bifunctional adenosylcobinamide kinase/adenosylcobinamide-phosphate guanylyltransferase [Sphingobium sp.]|nr:bifunctional adenosylcobinamide kinase/adenosylcobinamide-phosphate guanylyltransferase [Sphingobium sp.]
MHGSLLFIGGARSGKSRLAQAEAERGADPLTYIATAQAFDDEMADRIARHRADRGQRWLTIEAPIDLAAAIRRTTAGTLLVDCLTLWLSNLMLGEHDVASARDELVALVRDPPVPMVLVSNEVGMGIVPETPLGRAFRDEAGRLNQAVAEAATRVKLVVAGLSIDLK